MTGTKVFLSEAQTIPTQKDPAGAKREDFHALALGKVELPAGPDRLVDVSAAALTGKVAKGASLYAWVVATHDGVERVVAVDVLHDMAVMHNRVRLQGDLVTLKGGSTLEVRLLQASGQPLAILPGEAETYLAVRDHGEAATGEEPEPDEPLPDPTKR